MQYNNYLQVDKAVDRLFAKKQYRGALDLLNAARVWFPERLAEILVYASIVHLFNEDQPACLDVIEESLGRGFFMNLEWNVFDPLRDNARFKAAFEANLRARQAAQQAARMRYEVLLPKGYAKDQRHPLFIACHGNMSALEPFKERWTPGPMLKRGFVVAYIQSSQVICTDGFVWTNDWETTRREIQTCYNEVTRDYAIDPQRILLGGFSAGGIAAIEVTMANLFPVRGFITLCSSRKPESFTPRAVRAARARGVRAAMMHGALEEAPEEREMEKVFREVELPVQLVTNHRMGHVFPSNFPQKLGAAIDFVMA